MTTLNKETIRMKRGSTFFLRAAVAAVGIVIAALCAFALPAAWIGVAKEYDDITYALYGLIVAMYVAAIPFFIALYQALRLLDYIDKSKAFSLLSVKALKRIAYCGVAVAIVYAASMPLFYIWAENDDAPGLIVIGMAFVGASLTVAVFAAVLQRLLKEAIAIKSENDLTV